MGRVHQFEFVLTSFSDNDHYEDAIHEWVYDGESVGVAAECICGQAIQRCFVVRNDRNRSSLVVGSCCIRKVGVARDHFNGCPRAFLAYAGRRVAGESDKAFIAGLQQKLSYYGSLRLYPDQKARLDRIAGHEYRWRWQW